MARLLLLFLLGLSSAHAGVSPELLKRLRDPDNNLRRDALTRISRDPGSIDPAVIPFLVETLVRDKDFTLQEKAALMLAEHPAPGAVLGLLRVLESPETYAGHSAAALGLSRVKKALVIEPLLKALGAKSERTRKFALEGLAPFIQTDARISQAFLDVATGDEDLLNNQLAARALVQTQNSTTVAELVASLRDPKNRGAAPIATELGKAQVRLAVPALVHLLRSPQKELQLAGMKSLMNFSSEKIRTEVRAYLATSGIDPVARDYAIEYLALAGDVKAHETFRELLRDPSERSTIKRFAIMGLRSSQEGEDLHALSNLLSDEDRFQRQEALKSLKAMLAERAEFPGLLDVLLNYKI